MDSGCFRRGDRGPPRNFRNVAHEARVSACQGLDSVSGCLQSRICIRLYGEEMVFDALVQVAGLIEATLDGLIEVTLLALFIYRPGQAVANSYTVHTFIVCVQQAVARVPHDARRTSKAKILQDLRQREDFTPLPRNGFTGVRLREHIRPLGHQCDVFNLGSDILHQHSKICETMQWRQSVDHRVELSEGLIGHRLVNSWDFHYQIIILSRVTASPPQ